MILDRGGASALPAPAKRRRAAPAARPLLEAAFGWMAALGGHGDPNRKV